MMSGIYAGLLRLTAFECKRAGRIEAVLPLKSGVCYASRWSSVTAPAL